jgi:hypothetical protein
VPSAQIQVAPGADENDRASPTGPIQNGACRSLRWLTANLEAFDPCPGGRLEEWGVKAFGELALVYACLREWDRPGLSEHLPAWRSFLVDRCEDPIFAQRARKGPATAFAYLVPYLMLRSTGYRSGCHEETLALLARRKLLRAPELVPYRLMEREHALWKSGWMRREPAWRRLARATPLLRCRSLALLDDEAAYSATHTLFYLTDFGNREADLGPVELERAADTVECLLVHYVRIGHWDLVGELLVNLHSLRRWGSPICEAAARAYHAAWRDDGTVPGTRDEAPTKGREAGAGRGPGRRWTKASPLFRQRYHPTLVAVLYCAAALNARVGRALS